MSKPQLSEQVAVITGGGSGIGLAIAHALARAGAAVVLAGRDEARVSIAAEEVAQASGGTAFGCVCDVREESSVDRLMRTALDRFERIDVLVNSAGIVVRGAIESVTREAFEDSLATNVTGTWLACRAVGQTMRQAGYGRVVNLSSALGLVGAADRTAYAVAKGAIVALTRALAVEWAPHGIAVNALAPGLFLTDANREAARRPGGLAHLEREVPALRWGDLEEVAAAAVYLAGAQAGYTTGVTLPVDGGWTAH